jgi:hypothetical protein
VNRSLLSRRGTAASSVTVALVAAAGLAGPASAATPQSTGIRFSTQMPTITYADRQVTLQGTLTTSGGGVANEPVTLTELPRGGPRAALGTVTTGPDGTFSLTTTLPTLGAIQAVFAGDGAYGPSNSAVTTYPGTRLPARVSLDPPSPVTTGSTLKFTGLVEMQTPDGAWTPVPNTLLECTDGKWEGWSGYTGADGRFSIAFPAFGAKGEGLQWGVTTVETRESFAAEARSPLASVELNPGQTRITGAYSGPQPATAQSGLSFTGHVDALIDGQWQGNDVSQAYLNLYFQPRGATTWTLVDSLEREAATGNYHLNAFSPYRWNGTAYTLAQGSWQARVEPSSTNRWLPSSTPSMPINVTVQTTVNGLGIQRSTHTRALVGALNIHSGPALPSNLPRGLAKQTVKVYYHAKGSSTWHYLTTATTASNGAFRSSLTHRAHGYDRIVFPSGGSYTGTTTSSVYYSG